LHQPRDVQRRSRLPFLILAAIVVPKFSGRTEQARQAAAQSQISVFGTALDAFEVDMGYYPKGKNGLQIVFS